MNKELLEKWKNKEFNFDNLLEKQDYFDEVIIKIFGINSALDGISDFNRYAKKGTVHILWILKEPDCLIGSDFPIYDMRNFNREKMVYSKYTHINILRVTTGILEYVLNNMDMNYKNLPELIDDGEERIFYNRGGKKIFPSWEFAYINVKKSWGTSKSIQGVINGCYRNDTKGKLLREQVDYINPDIIINCSGEKYCSCDLAGIERKEFNKFNNSEDAFPWALYNDRVVIHAYHPNAHISDEEYCTKIFNAVKRATE